MISNPLSLAPSEQKTPDERVKIENKLHFIQIPSVQKQNIYYDQVKSCTNNYRTFSYSNLGLRLLFKQLQSFAE